MFLDGAANLQRAFHRRFRRIVKNQRHPITGWNCYQAMVRVGFPELFRLADDLVERLEQAALLIDQELGVADDVNKEHVGYLELDLLFDLRHRLSGILALRHGKPQIILSARGRRRFSQSANRRGGSPNRGEASIGRKLDQWDSVSRTPVAGWQDLCRPPRPQ